MVFLPMKSFELTLLPFWSTTVNSGILSPIFKDGKFFDSRDAVESMPKDGDANGAYHIALKGLRLINNQIDENGNIVLDKKGKANANWFKYAQDVATNK